MCVAPEEEGSYGEEWEEEGTGGNPVAVIATRANTPEARYAEAQCDKERDSMEEHGYEIGNFTGKYTAEPGERYKGTNYELLYETELILLPFGAHSTSVGRKRNTCQVIVDSVRGHYKVTHGPHFRLGQGLPSKYVT